jgi:hypothetical protein
LLVNSVPAFVGQVVQSSTKIHHHLKGRNIMLKSKSLLAVALAAAFALPLAANAAGTERPSGSTSPGKSGSMSSGNGGSMSTMKQLDTNNDGHVSKEEAKKSSAISKRFKELDKDNDGKLSSTELSAAGATGAGGSGKESSPAAPGGTGSAPKKSY